MTTQPPTQPNGHIPQAVPVAPAAVGPPLGIERSQGALTDPPAALATERIQVKLADIQFDPNNAHKHPPEGIQCLAASIAEIGLLTEPLGYLDPQTGRPILIAGEGRVRAMI